MPADNPFRPAGSDPKGKCIIMFPLVVLMLSMSLSAKEFPASNPRFGATSCPKQEVMPPLSSVNRRTAIKNRLRRITSSDVFIWIRSFTRWLSAIQTPKWASSLALLQAQQYQNRTLTLRQRLKGFANQCAGSMKLNAADVDRLGLHRHSRNIAGDE